MVYQPLHKARPGRPFGTILAYNLPYWREYLIGSMLAAAFVLIGLAMPLVLRGVVSRFESHTMTARLLATYFAGLLSVAVATGFARYWERTLIIGASRKCEYDLRNDLFRHIQLLSQDFFHRTPTGGLMARSTNDLNYVRMFIGPGIMGSIDMMRLPFTLALMIYMSGRLTIVSLLPLPLVSLLVYGFIMYMHRQSEKVQEQFSVVTARVQENLAGARVVQAYGIADREFGVFRRESVTYMRENMKLAAVMSFAWPLIGLLVAGTVLLVLWEGGKTVIEGGMSLGDLTGFIVCMLILVWPLAEFGWIMTLYQRGSVGMNRINEIFAEIPSVRDDERTRPDLVVADGAICFENVSFAYRSGDSGKETPALRDIDLTISPGETIGIVGPTGSGKSTLISLIVREFDPSSGAISVDGHDVREYSVANLRGAIGYVPQDTFLFSDTIRTNLTFGHADAPEDAIRHACEVAQFAETVSELEDGYETLLGERGVNLSGGQKQRLAIARAVLRNPKILILDDALSSVDTHTEERIIEGLRDVMKTRTSLIVSHRLSTLRHAHRIFVVEEGRIVEHGTHDELMERGGLYARTYERQLLEEELEQA